MQYPLISEYIEAIHSAEYNFDKLKNLRPVLDDAGIPIMSSGNFAVVFKMTDGNNYYALKCFLREQKGREESYRLITEYLNTYEKPSYLISVTYYEKELFVDSTQTKETEFPVLLMDWVEGLCLEEYIQSIINNKMKLRKLADDFQKFICWLLPQHIAHGDLKPDNIIIKSDGSIVLIDYDGMFVPVMFGQKAREQGTPMFQYRGRSMDDFDEYIDDYPAVLILLLLKVISIHPSTIDKYLTPNNIDFIRQFDNYLEDKRIAPLISAYIMVSSFGRLDRQIISSLLSDNSAFDTRKESQLIHAAHKGDTKAMIKLGDLYYYGIYVPKSYSKAIQWYELAISLGDIKASCGLCKCYFYGDDFNNEKNLFIDKLEKNKIGFAICRKGEELLNMDNVKAKQYFSLGHEINFSHATSWLAYIYDQNGDECTAANLYQESALQGDPLSQSKLGWKYYFGRGLEINYKNAVKWWTKAAEQDDTYAQSMLGVCYERGNGVQKDISKSFKYYSKAAYNGDSYAEYKLEQYNRLYQMNDVVNIQHHELPSSVGESNTGTYSIDGKRFLCYWGTYGEELTVKEGTEILCNECFNDLYNEIDGHYLKTLYLPSSLKRIGSNVFCASISNIICKSKSFIVENDYFLSADKKTLIRYLGNKDTINIPDGVKYIKGGAFSEMNIIEVTIPKSVIGIGDNPFAGTSELKITSLSDEIKILNDILYDIKEKRLISYLGDDENICIPNGVKLLGANSFFGKTMRQIKLPQSLEYIDETAFYWCFNLEQIIVPKGMKNISRLIPAYLQKLIREI